MELLSDIYSFKTEVEWNRKDKREQWIGSTTVKNQMINLILKKDWKRTYKK